MLNSITRKVNAEILFLRKGRHLCHKQAQTDLDAAIKVLEEVLKVLASPQPYSADPGVSHKSDEYLWGGKGYKHTA